MKDKWIKKQNWLFLEGWYIIAHNDLQSLIRPECDGTSEGEGEQQRNFFLLACHKLFHGHTVKSRWPMTINCKPCISMGNITNYKRNHHQKRSNRSKTSKRALTAKQGGEGTKLKVSKRRDLLNRHQEASMFTHR